MHCFSWGAGSVISWAISWGLSYFLLRFTLPFPGVSMPHSLPSIRFLMQSRYNNIPLCWQPCSLRVHHKPGAVLGTSPTPQRQNYPHFTPEIIIPRCTLSDWWNWSGFWNRWHLGAMWQMAVMDTPENERTWSAFLTVWADSCSFSVLQSACPFRMTRI